LPLRGFSSYDNGAKFFTFDPSLEFLPKNLLKGSSVIANFALAALHDGARRCLRGELDAFVTAPVNKESIIRAGHKFVGQTEFLSELAGAKRTAMMLLGTDDRGRWRFHSAARGSGR